MVSAVKATVFQTQIKPNLEAKQAEMAEEMVFKRKEVILERAQKAESGSECLSSLDSASKEILAKVSAIAAYDAGAKAIEQQRPEILNITS